MTNGTATSSPTRYPSNMYPDSFQYEDKDKHSFEIRYNSYISLAELANCIHNIVKAVISEEFGYTPYFYDVALYSCILESYTDFDSSMPLEDVYALLSATNLKKCIEDAINGNQLNTIQSCSLAMIEFQKQRLLADTGFEALLKELRRLLAKVADEVDSELIATAISRVPTMGNFHEDNHGEPPLV